MKKKVGIVTIMKTIEVDVKSCPFCKTMDIEIGRKDIAHGVEKWVQSWVCCYGCGVRGPVELSDEKAVTGWNAMPRSE